MVKGLRTVMARLRSLIRPSLISPRAKLIGVPTIRLPAVITLKIPPNQQSYAATILIQYACCVVCVSFQAHTHVVHV